MLWWCLKIRTREQVWILSGIQTSSSSPCHNTLVSNFLTKACCHIHTPVMMITVTRMISALATEMPKHHRVAYR